MPSSSRLPVIITGSSGLIGRAVAERLHSDYELIGMDSKAPKRLHPFDEFVPLDLTSDASVEEGLQHVNGRYGPHLASVIHLAAYYDFSGEPSSLYEAVTVQGTARLLRSLARLEPQQFVFSSTMLVHAPTKPGQPIREDSAIEPKWDYPASKVKTEEVVRRHSGSVPFVILRIAGVYDDHCHSIPLANQVQRIFERKLISHVYPGELGHGQAFVHLNDVVDALERVVRRRGELGHAETFLIGEPETASYEELQHAIGALVHGESWETRNVPKAVAKAGAWLQEQAPGEDPFIKPWMIDLADDHYELDIERARSRLGWEPKRRLLATLPIAIAELKKDPESWYRENKLEPPAWLEPRAPSESAAE